MADLFSFRESYAIYCLNIAGSIVENTLGNSDIAHADLTAIGASGLNVMAGLCHGKG